MNESIFLEPINKYEIRNVICNLNRHKSCGPNDISPRLITEIVDELLRPLEYIYNKFMLTGIVPENLKLAKVIPVYKKGSKTEVSNYRSISLLNTFNKIFEKLIYKRIYSFLKKYNILNPVQFGFRQSHSTSLALMNVIDQNI